MRLKCDVVADNRTSLSVTWKKDNDDLDIGERITVEKLADTFHGIQKYKTTVVIRMVTFHDEG